MECETSNSTHFLRNNYDNAKTYLVLLSISYVFIEERIEILRNILHLNLFDQFRLFLLRLLLAFLLGLHSWLALILSNYGYAYE